MATNLCRISSKAVKNVSATKGFTFGAIAAGALTSIIQWINVRRIGENSSSLPTEDEARVLAKEAIADDVGLEGLKRFAATNDPEERREIKEQWRRKMLARGVESLSRNP